MTSTIKIAAGTLNTLLTTNGYDYFLSVGDNVVTLSGAARIDELSIVNSKGKAIKYSVNKKIVGTSGADTFVNYLDNATISAGKGIDTIRSYGASVSIVAGDGDDSIENTGDKTTVLGGAGNDFITNEGANVTISAGTGNDFVGNSSKNVFFKYSGGNDTINGFDETSTLQIASGKLNSVITSDGLNYYLTVGKNTITLWDAARYKNINIVDSKGKAIDFRVKANIVGTRVKDNLHNYADNATINGDVGNDYINNNRGNNVSITGGKGDDTIYSSGGNNVTINSGTRATILFVMPQSQNGIPKQENMRPCPPITSQLTRVQATIQFTTTARKCRLTVATVMIPFVQAATT